MIIYHSIQRLQKDWPIYEMGAEQVGREEAREGAREGGNKGGKAHSWWVGEEGRREGRRDGGYAYPIGQSSVRVFKSLLPPSLPPSLRPYNASTPGWPSYMSR